MNEHLSTHQSAISRLYRTHGKAELVGGNLVRMPPTGGRPGYAAGELFVSLRLYGRETGLGMAVGDNVGFLVDLPDRQSFSPDVAFWTGPAPTMKFHEGAPILAIEIRSETDYGDAAERALAAKRADYFQAGTQLVWDVDLLGVDVVRSYCGNASAAAEIFRRGQTAHAEPAIAGWTFAVDCLFP